LSLPEEALQKLRQLDVLVTIGDIWGIPEPELNYRSGKPYRFAVVVAVELDPETTKPVLAHLVVGSTRPERYPSIPEVVIPAGNAGLREDTYFSFRESSPLAVRRLKEVGRFIGRLSVELLPRIDRAIASTKTSTLVAVKKARG